MNQSVALTLLTETLRKTKLVNVIFLKFHSLFH